MKNLKKLFVAAVMLVVALTAVVSSTYAWFTMQNQVDVNQIELNVGSAGKDLQISTTGVEGTWGYEVTLGTIDGILTPVTYDIKTGEVGFKQLALDSTTNSYFVYKNATAFTAGTTAPTGSAYLTYDLYFRSSQELSLKLDVDKSIFAEKVELDPEDIKILGAIRLMVTVGSTNYIWEPFTTIVAGQNSGTYGTGDYYNAANSWIALDAFLGDPGVATDDMLALNGSTYELKQAPGQFFDGRIYTPATPATVSNPASGAAYHAITLGTLTADTPQKITITIWIEGWDGDANNDAALSAFTSYLMFKGE